MPGSGRFVPVAPSADIGAAIEQTVKERAGIVREFVGHEIGTEFHGPTIIPHFFDAEATTVMYPGMTFTIEPMLTEGSPAHRIWPDGWTATTTDGGRSTQFEHTLLVTEDGADVLTTHVSTGTG